jgi:uncharacterized protein DUF3455
MTLLRATATIGCMMMTYGASGAELPDEIAAKGETVVFQAHAEGAQIYECKAAQSGGQLSWQFREPVAALFQKGKTVGLHYAGPKWEIEDSLITAKVSASVPSPSGKDIPWLKLEVTTEADAGPLQDVTAVQRINTIGGVLEGTCENTGELRPAPYGADYVFLRKQ